MPRGSWHSTVLKTIKYSLSKKKKLRYRVQFVVLIIYNGQKTVKIRGQLSMWVLRNVFIKRNTENANLSEQNLPTLNSNVFKKPSFNILKQTAPGFATFPTIYLPTIWCDIVWSKQFDVLIDVFWQARFWKRRFSFIFNQLINFPLPLKFYIFRSI